MTVPREPDGWLVPFILAVLTYMVLFVGGSYIIIHVVGMIVEHFTK